MTYRCLFLAVAGVLALAHAGPAQTGEVLNLAVNPGFEDAVVDGTPPGWVPFTTRSSGIAVVTEGQRSGSQCVRIAAQAIRDQVQGLFQSLPVTAGVPYSFSVRVQNDKGEPLGGSAYGLLLIEWKDADGTIIRKEESTPWRSTLSQLRWDSYSLKKLQAPENAVSANFCIHLGEGGRGARGAILVDDILIASH